MEMIKLSELKDDEKITDGNGHVYDVEEVKNDLQYFKDESKKLYTVTEYQASFNAKDILEDVIENEACNGMYEDWEESIMQDIEDEDVEALQRIFDRILARDSDANISYIEDKLIEIDM